jgi:hypothetical protein
MKTDEWHITVPYSEISALKALRVKLKNHDQTPLEAALLSLVSYLLDNAAPAG